MSWLVDALSGALILSGGGLSITGAIGLLRLPDFYSRTHAGGLTDTLGALLILLGLILQAGFSLIAVKLAMIAVLLHVAAPTGAHALAKAAYSRGVRVRGDSVDPPA